MNRIIIIFLVIFSSFITAFSQILLKISAEKNYRHIIFEYVNPYVIISYFFYALVLVLNVLIYTKLDFRFGIIINSLPTVMILIMSKLWLKEHISIRRVLGNIIILAGIICFLLS